MGVFTISYPPLAPPLSTTLKNFAFLGFYPALVTLWTLLLLNDSVGKYNFALLLCGTVYLLMLLIFFRFLDGEIILLANLDLLRTKLYSHRKLL